MISRVTRFQKIVALMIVTLTSPGVAAAPKEFMAHPAATPQTPYLQSTVVHVSSPESQIHLRREVPKCPETCAAEVPADGDARCYEATCDKLTGTCVTRALSGGIFDREESLHTCSTIPQRCDNGKLVDAPELITSTTREGEQCDVLSNGEKLRTGKCDPMPRCVRGQCVQAAPSPTCTEEECNLYRFDMNIGFLAKGDDLATSPGGAYSETGRPDHDPVTFNDTGLTCLDHIFDTARTAADKYITGDNDSHTDFRGARGSQYWDDRFAKSLMWGNLAFKWDRDCAPEDKFKEYIPGQNYYDYVDKICKKVTIFFDKNCKRITNPESTNACKSAGVLIYLSSPISLEWDGSEKAGHTVSVVNFPLHPSELGASWIWKASDKLPLLVYDPEHKGDITSAQQLFGNWTFGGQRSASASLDATSTARPWKHGYEALETLDINHDGKVSGEELAPLGLWFDGDRDGVSQPGEVVPVSKAGLQELYYESPKTNPSTKDVELKIGFKRIDSSGKEYIGGSVDWYSDRARHPGELFMRHVNQDFNKAGSTLPELPTTNTTAMATNSAAHAPIAGAWEWNFSGDHLDKGQKVGVLVFTQTNDGRILGRSIVQAPILGNNEATSMVYASLLDGKFIDRDSFSFYVASGDGIIESEAHLNDDGTRIIGRTIFTAKDQQRVIYKWSAKRKSFTGTR